MDRERRCEPRRGTHPVVPTCRYVWTGKAAPQLERRRSTGARDALRLKGRRLAQI